MIDVAQAIRDNAAPLFGVAVCAVAVAGFAFVGWLEYLNLQAYKAGLRSLDREPDEEPK